MTLPVYIGGLMRCCTASLYESEAFAKDEPAFECKYCKNPMVNDSNNHSGRPAWRWDREKSLKG